MYNPEQQREREIEQARREITMYDAAMLLCQNNDLACEIHIAGLKVGIIDNAMAIPALERTKEEIEKFLRGEPNEWE